MSLNDYLKDNGFELLEIEKPFKIEKGSIKERACFLNSSSNKKFKELSKSEEFKEYGLWKSANFSFNDEEERNNFINYCNNSKILKLEGADCSIMSLTLVNHLNPNKSINKFALFIIDESNTITQLL